MKTIHDQSYGIIPVIKRGDGWYIFMLQQIARRGDLVWTFPKGHPEADEDPETTARRELAEEAGIELASIDPTCTFSQMYTYEFNGEIVEKHVTYFLGYAAAEAFHMQPEEVADAAWYSLAEAREKATFDITKETVNAVAEALQNV